MTEIPYVCLYVSYLQSLAPFTDKEKGRILTAMLSYAATGQVPEMEGNARYIWPTIQAQIDRDAEAYADRCRKNQVNGAKGGRPRKNQPVKPETEWFSEKPKKPKEKEKEKENEKENEKEKENERENEKKKENEKENLCVMADKPPAPARFAPPGVEEVQQYCRERNYCVDPERFVNYYESIGWMVGKNRMKNWKAALRNWNRKEQELGTSNTNNPKGSGRGDPEKAGPEQIWPAIGIVL